MKDLENNSYIIINNNISKNKDGYFYKKYNYKKDKYINNSIINKNINNYISNNSNKKFNNVLPKIKESHQNIIFQQKDI